MPPLQDVLEQLEAGFYVVPEVQREFVWRNSQVRDLLDSIYRNDPIGGIVYWELPPQLLSDENLADLFRPLSEDLSCENWKYMIIDGQQRLTSLLLVKKGKILIRRRGGERERSIRLYFNPIEEDFELGSRRIAEKAEWFNVTEVINSDDVLKLIEDQAQKFGEDSIKENPKVRKNLINFQRTFATYELHLVPAKLSYTGDFLSTFERIAKIFVNLNMRGTRIRMPDLALALLTARMRKDIGDSFRDEFETLLKKAEDKGYALEETVLMRIYSAISTGTTKFNDAKKVLEKTSGEEIRKFLKDTEDSIFKAIKLLQDFGINSSSFLQSSYLLTPIAYLLYKEPMAITSDRMRSGLEKWLILASHEKRYTGKLETDLFGDVEQIKQGKSVDGLVENLRVKEIPFSTLNEDYEKRHLTLLLMLAKRTGAMDWDLKNPREIKKVSELAGEDQWVHHIFPKEFLERRGFEEKFDNFGNITIISKQANNSLKFKDPRKYLQELQNVSSELLKKHFVPENEDLWHIDNFDGFLRERAKLMAEAVEREFGIKVLGKES
jgi:hypothetical protein